jgi:hypothetical protein
MLTIRGYMKLNDMDVNPNYHIREVKESNNFYDFYMVNNQTGYTAVIGLNRNMNRIYKGENLYDMIWNGQPTQVSVTSNWIADRDNMIKGLISVIEERPW